VRYVGEDTAPDAKDLVTDVGSVIDDENVSCHSLAGGV
jgi:hypothetical protein